MELLSKILLIIHITAGASTLITGPFAIFYNFKDPKKHRMVGKAFFYAMLVVAFSAMVAYFKHPEIAFFQLLFGIAWVVLCDILRGVRSILIMKGSQVIRFDWIYTAALALNGLWMIGLSLWHFTAGTMVAIPILFGVFGFMSMQDVRVNWRVFSKPEVLHRLDWMRLHAGTMLGAFTASTTAFTVNAAHFLPWWAQWFGPTLLLVPLQFYFGRKLKATKDAEQKMPNEAFQIRNDTTTQVAEN